MGMLEDVISNLSDEMNKAVESLKHDLGKLRTGRASVSILDGVKVDYYGTATPLNQCANLMVADARLIVVKPWDKKLLSDIDKAIRAAGLGLNPQSDGEILRLPIPPLTEERRKDLVKQAKHRVEEAKIGIRNHRRDGIDMLKELEEEKEITQDDLKRALEKVQALVDEVTGQVDKVLESKEKDIMTV